MPGPLMLFAAGFGTRMRPLTDDKPKPMIEVAGKPLIDHALDIALSAGCSPIVANLHYKPEVLHRHLTARNVETVLEMPDILDTGGGLKNAMPLLGTGPVTTMNTDAVWTGTNPVTALEQAWDPDRMDALLMCVPVGQTVAYTGTGDFSRDQDGRLHRGAGLVYGGVQILKPELLSDVEATVFSLNVVWNRIAERGRLFGLEHNGRWCDVGHPGGIVLAEDMLRHRDE